MEETGVPKLDELFAGGIPKGKSLVYYMQQGVEGEVFGLQTIYTTLKNGGVCVFVASSTSPSTIKDQFEELGWDIESFENRLTFVDTKNLINGFRETEKNVVSNPDNVEDFSNRITNLIKELPSCTIVFDSLSSIMDIYGEKETVEAIKTWNKIAGLREHILVYNCMTWHYSQDTLNLIKKVLFNAVVSINITAERIKFGQYFEVLKSDWTKELDKSMFFFDVLKPGGIKLSKILITGPFDQKPKVIYKHISNTKSKWVRFGLVQLDFSLESLRSPEEFGYSLNEKEKTKEKIIEALKIAEKNKVNIVCFPELSFQKGWIDEIKNRSKEIAIIGGSYYDRGYNICPIIINGKYIDPPYKKHRPSPFETPEIAGRGMKSGNYIYIFQTKYGRFSVLTCIDYTDQSYPVCRYKYKGIKGVDFIINPCYEKNIRRVQYRCNSDCEDYGISIIQVNRAPEGKKYGGTCIISKEHEIILERLKDDGFKPNDDIKYKICQADYEMIIIVDLNIEIKAPPVDLPIDYAGRVHILKEYKYEKGNWLSITI